MRLLITGLSGTLAPVLARCARARGIAVLGFDHRLLDSPQASARYLDQLQPSAIAHLAMAPAAASAELAAQAQARGLPMVLTSTAMVFDRQPDGPHRVDDRRNAQDDYGRSKIAVEDAVRAAHPGASIVRIGWQIDASALAPGSNNMLAQLDRWQAEQGEVAASTAWRPACSFMEDTAEALLALLAQPGTHHVDSNAEAAWSFAQLVLALRQRFERRWQVREHADYVHDQRLLPAAATAYRVPDLRERLAA